MQHTQKLEHRHGWHCIICEWFSGDRNFCPNCGFRKDEKIEIGYSEIPRYYYHRPPSDQLKFAKAGKGLKAYKNKSFDGSTEAIEQAFNAKDPEIIWLSPENVYGESYIVDTSKLNKNNIKPTGQFEGNIWHLGDIPPEAVIGYQKKGDQNGN